jgi:DNA-directed RNA polymerase specialized sigma24 family protein
MNTVAECFAGGLVKSDPEPFHPRTMNRMDDETKLVHARLEQWGRWARNDGIRAWPPVTILGRVMEEGPHGSRATGKPPTALPDVIAHCDAAVSRLGPVDRRVIRKYYLEWAPIEAMAHSLHMREASFKAVLRRARWRISGYLSAIESTEI